MFTVPLVLQEFFLQNNDGSSTLGTWLSQIRQWPPILTSELTKVFLNRGGVGGGWLGEMKAYTVEKQSFWLKRHDMVFVLTSYILCDEWIRSLVFWWVISEGGSDPCASRTSCTMAACVQQCLPMCPCQSDEQQPPALLMSFCGWINLKESVTGSTASVWRH